MGKKFVKWIHKGVDYTIQLSDKPDKKLLATYQTKAGKTKKIYFGGVREDGQPYEHYFDKTGLLDKKLNHKDKERRRLYRARHTNDRLDEPSPGLLSWHLLW